MSNVVRCETKTLNDVVENFMKLRWRRPNWQREDAWTPKKKQNFDKVIREKINGNHDDWLVGTIILYRVGGDGDLFILDGLQRTTNSQRIYHKVLEENNKDEDLISKLFSKVAVNVMILNCESESEAKKEYLNINQGTPLTPSEQVKTILSDLPNYLDWETRIFDKLIHGMEGVELSIKLNSTKKREKKQEIYRDYYSIFFRYLSNEKQLCDYSFNVDKITDESKSYKLLERKLFSKLVEIGIDEVEKKLNDFLTYMQDCAIELEGYFEEVKKHSTWKSSVMNYTPASFRWYLHFCVWRKNAKFPIPKSKEIITILLKASKGGTQFDVSGEKSMCINKSGLSKVRYLSKKLGFDIDLKRDRPNTSQMKVGYDQSHINSFAHSGNGPMIPLPSNVNKSQGTKSINTDGVK